MIVIVCPGQGSQTPGFLGPWLELPGLRDQLTALSDAAGVDLVAHGTTSDEDTIKDTAVAQPLLVGAGLLALRALGGGREQVAPDRREDVVGVTAEHGAHPRGRGSARLGHGPPTQGDEAHGVGLGDVYKRQPRRRASSARGSSCPACVTS